MNINSFVELLEKSNSENIYEIYIPSLGKSLNFKPLTTGQQKSVSKLSLDANDFNASYELTRLSLFDALCVDEGFTSNDLKENDLCSFLAGIRKNNINVPLEVRIGCNNCDTKFNFKVDLDKIMESCKEAKIQKFEFATKHNNLDFKIILSSPKYKNIIEFEEYFRLLKEEGMVDSIGKYKIHTEPLLYIEEISIGGDKLEKFGELSFIKKLQIYEKIPPQVTIADDNSILSTILDNFSKDNIFDPIKCPGCGNILEGVVTYDSFFLI